jgi:hypothetical protein
MARDTATGGRMRCSGFSAAHGRGTRLAGGPAQSPPPRRLPHEPSPAPAGLRPSLPAAGTGTRGRGWLACGLWPR